jgi:hypothetical protein
MALTDPWSGKDDAHYGYYDTQSGTTWRLCPEPGQPPATNPGGRVARPRRVSPSLIARTWHSRPGRGSVRSDKETP